MKKVSEFYFRYNAEKYLKLRDGIESVFPGLTNSDGDVKRWLDEMDFLEHRIKHHIMHKYCVEDDE